MVLTGIKFYLCDQMSDITFITLTDVEFYFYDANRC